MASGHTTESRGEVDFPWKAALVLLWAFEVWMRYGLSGAHLQFISNLSLCCQSTMQHICIAGGRVSSRTNPSLWYACERQAVFGNRTLHPFPFAEWKSLFSQNTAAHRLSFLLKVHLNGGNFLYFPRIVIMRKRRTKSTFWHHFWKGFEPIFQNHFPNWKSDDFCGI